MCKYLIKSLSSISHDWIKKDTNLCLFLNVKIIIVRGIIILGNINDNEW